MTRSENLINYISTFDANKPIYRQNDEFMDHNNTKGFKKLSSKESIELVTKYLETKSLDDEQIPKVRQFLTNVTTASPKSGGILDKIKRTFSNFASVIKNAVTFKGFHTDNYYAKKTAEKLLQGPKLNINEDEKALETQRKLEAEKQAELDAAKQKAEKNGPQESELTEEERTALAEEQKKLEAELAEIQQKTKEMEAKAKAEAEEKARLEAEAKAKEQADAEKAKLAAEAKEQADAEKAKLEAEEKANQKAKERAEAEAEAKAKAEAEEKAKTELEKPETPENPPANTPSKNTEKKSNEGEADNTPNTNPEPNGGIPNDLPPEVEDTGDSHIDETDLPPPPKTPSEELIERLTSSPNKAQYEYYLNNGQALMGLAENANTREFNANMFAQLSDQFEHGRPFYNAVTNLLFAITQEDVDQLFEARDQKQTNEFITNLIGSLVSLCYYIESDKTIRDKGLNEQLQSDKKSQGATITRWYIKSDKDLAKRLVESLNTKKDPSAADALQNKFGSLVYTLLAWNAKDKEKENNAFNDLRTGLKNLGTSTNVVETWIELIENLAGDLK